MPVKQTQEEFILKSIELFGDQLDYSAVIYINARTLIILICKIHGPFKIKPAVHISYRRSCGFCSGHFINTEIFIERANIIHKFKYFYKETVFVNMKTYVIITCPIHGNFSQMPDKHINAQQGCPKCAGVYHMNTAEFIEIASIIHKFKYDYSLTQYVNLLTKIIVICPIHGEFSQLPSNHIHNKQGCPSCTIRVSKKETAWLDSLLIPDDIQHRSVVLLCGTKYIIADGYEPSTNTTYEFYGDFWHGNPKLYNPNDINKGNKKTFGELYDKTLEREVLLKDVGFNLVSIWECDWDLLNNIKIRKRD